MTSGAVGVSVPSQALADKTPHAGLRGYFVGRRVSSLLGVMTRVEVVTSRGAKDQKEFWCTAHDRKIHDGSKNKSSQPGDTAKNGEDPKKGRTDGSPFHEEIPERKKRRQGREAGYVVEQVARQQRLAGVS